MKRICIIASIVMMILFAADAGAQPELMEKAERAARDTAEYIYSAVPEPRPASAGGEWAVIGLARSGMGRAEYYDIYYNNLLKYLNEHNGILHDRKYTEYSRTVLALAAIGKDPSEVGGYNLLMPLGDYEKTVWQGINGAVWALIALDSGDYEIPQNPDAQVQATRELYIKYILDAQLPDGGWSLAGDTADIDITAMAVQALAGYRYRSDAENALQKALLCISDRQGADGGFAGGNCENTVQTIVALCSAGVSLEDAGFVKNNKTLLDNLLTYYEEKNGFKHTYGGGADQMASEQGLYALAAVQRFFEGKNTLYDMSDVLPDNAPVQTEPAERAVRRQEIVFPGRTFSDINENREAIEALAARNIINGRAEDLFGPEERMTRAEFAAIMVKGLGLEISGGNVFSDVEEQDWFCGYVNTAYKYGIVSGISETEFAPGAALTREAAAVMTARAAALCGIDTNMDITAARDILAGFTDYVKISEWAFSGTAFCCKSGIIDESSMEFNPQEYAVRADIAQMLFNMLGKADLL